MYCENCKKQIDENVAHCPYCGMPVEKGFYQQNIPQQAVPRKGLITGAKVFIVIGIIICVIYVIISFVFLLMNFSETLLAWIVMLILFIPGIVFGYLALKQMSERKPFVGICVCVLIFCNIIGGILLLCTENSDYIKT